MKQKFSQDVYLLGIQFTADFEADPVTKQIDFDSIIVHLPLSRFEGTFTTLDEIYESILAKIESKFRNSL